MYINIATQAWKECTTSLCISSRYQSVSLFS